MLAYVRGQPLRPSSAPWRTPLLAHVLADLCASDAAMSAECALAGLGWLNAVDASDLPDGRAAAVGAVAALLESPTSLVTLATAVGVLALFHQHVALPQRILVVRALVALDAPVPAVADVEMRAGVRQLEARITLDRWTALLALLRTVLSDGNLDPAEVCRGGWAVLGTWPHAWCPPLSLTLPPTDLTRPPWPRHPDPSSLHRPKRWLGPCGVHRCKRWSACGRIKRRPCSQPCRRCWQSVWRTERLTWAR